MTSLSLLARPKGYIMNRTTLLVCPAFSSNWLPHSLPGSGWPQLCVCFALFCSWIVGGLLSLPLSLLLLLLVSSSSLSGLARCQHLTVRLQLFA